jgi:hypothetical protein
MYTTQQSTFFAGEFPVIADSLSAPPNSALSGKKTLFVVSIHSRQNLIDDQRICHNI